MIAVLAVAAAVVWQDLLAKESTITRRVSCPPAPADADITPLPWRALRDVAPLPPGQVAVLVRNGTDTGGLAGRVAARLRLFGFAEAAPPDNDPVYPTDTLHCIGQIRFGEAGRAAARTVSLVAPCAQLVRDGRAEGTVDLVLGTGFTALEPNWQAREVLRTLREQAVQAHGGRLQSAPGAATAGSFPLLFEARPARC